MTKIGETSFRRVGFQARGRSKEKGGRKKGAWVRMSLFDLADKEPLDKPVGGRDSCLAEGQARPQHRPKYSTISVSTWKRQIKTEIPDRVSSPCPQISAGKKDRDQVGHPRSSKITQTPLRLQ